MEKYSAPIWGLVKEGKEREVRAEVQRNPACLEERGDVGETPLHHCFLFYQAEHRSIAFFLLEHDKQVPCCVSMCRPVSHVSLCPTVCHCVSVCLMVSIFPSVRHCAPLCP